jgi:hypothetical protein
MATYTIYQPSAQWRPPFTLRRGNLGAPGLKNAQKIKYGDLTCPREDYRSRHLLDCIDLWAILTLSLCVSRDGDSCKPHESRNGIEWIMLVDMIREGRCIEGLGLEA